MLGELYGMNQYGGDLTGKMSQYLESHFLINLGTVDRRILKFIRVKIVVKDLVFMQRVVRSRALFGNMGRAHWAWSRRACLMGLEVFETAIAD